MSNELTPQSSQPSPLGRPSSAQHAGDCTYCGAPLSAFYYFCLACGTPYKSMETVVTPARPRELTDEELVWLKVPQVATLFWTYLIVVISVGIFSFFLLREDRLDIHILLNEAAIFVTTCYFGWRYRKALGAQLKVFGFNKPEAWIGLALLPVVLAINYGYHGLLSEMLPSEDGDPFQKLRESGVTNGTLIVTFCIFPAILEEIAYRGLVQHWLQLTLANWKALVVASFLFAATHLSILSLPYLFLVGMLLGWVKLRTGSLYPSMLIHFLHNFVVIELFSKEW